MCALKMPKTFKHSLHNLMSIPNRTKSKSMYRIHCAKDPFPPCTPEKLKKSECMKRREQRKKLDNPFHKFWENPECCIEPCMDQEFPRFDDLYYKISDKAKRKYQQTWLECPRVKRNLVQCCYEQIIAPTMKRRGRKPKTACNEQVEKCIRRGECPKLRLKGCKKVRDPPKCFAIKRPSDCRKICTPYPAFSECNKPKPNPRPPKECFCLDMPSWCEIFAMIREGKLPPIKEKKPPKKVEKK